MSEINDTNHTRTLTEELTQYAGEIKSRRNSLLIDAAVSTIQSLERDLKGYQAIETWHDNETDLTWRRPTAWAYAQLCKIRDDLKKSDEANKRLIAKLQVENENLKGLLKLLNKFAKDAATGKLDFNEDITASWVSFVCSKVDEAVK